MKKFKWAFSPLIGLAIVGGGVAWHLHRYPAYLRPADRIIIARWLLRNPGYRLARPADCGDCETQVSDLRDTHAGPESLIPGFTPYYARGDFNQDGKMDFALAVIDENAGESPFSVLIFNGPLNALNSTPAYISEGLSLGGGGLFYFPNRTDHDNALMAGPFNSDNTVLFSPQGDTYVPDYGDDEEEPSGA